MSNPDAKLLKFDFKQGFHRESTQYAEEGGSPVYENTVAILQLQKLC